MNTSQSEYSNYINTSKTNLAKAITSAGVTTSGTDSFEIMANNIKSIKNNISYAKFYTEDFISIGTNIPIIEYRGVENISETSVKILETGNYIFIGYFRSNSNIYGISSGIYINEQFSVKVGSVLNTKSYWVSSPIFLNDGDIIEICAYDTNYGQLFQGNVTMMKVDFSLFE